MEFTKDIQFDDSLKAGKESKITYSGFLFQNGSNKVNIVYGFGEAWNNTTTKPMEKTENGFVTNVRMRDFDTFNFCFSDENNNWDNNNYFNYISPILPELKEEFEEQNLEQEPENNFKEAALEFGTDYSASIDDIIDEILGNTVKQDILTDKDNNSIDKILESITKDTLPEIEALFNDLFFESVKEDENSTSSIPEISMDPSLAEELKEVGVAVESQNFVTLDEVPENNEELIKLFNELFEVSKEPISFEFEDNGVEKAPVQENIKSVDEPKLNVASFNLDGLVSDLLEPIITCDNPLDKVDETSLFEDLKAHEDDAETSLAVIDSKEFIVSPRRLGYFYKLKKRIRLAFLKLAKIPKDFVKQLGL